MNFPKAFEEMFRTSFGDRAWESYQQSSTQPPVRALRLNPKRPVHKRLLPKLSQPVPWAKTAYYIDHTLKWGSDPLHAGGEYYLQEPSAMAPVTALQPQKGECILDLCAAPGSKTTQIAAVLEDSGVLVANEIHRERCLTLAENTERMGLSQVCVTNLEPRTLADSYREFFDAILVDAPCSGEGMFRKDPEAITQWNEELLLQNADRQLDILESAYHMTKTPGRIVYSTCTFNPVENEGVLLRFLTLHPDLQIVSTKLLHAQPGLSLDSLHTIATRYAPLAKILPETLQIDDLRLDTSRAARYFPDSSQSEGHFIALIEKRATLQQQSANFPNRPSAKFSKDHTKHRTKRKQFEHTAQEKVVIRLFEQFAQDTLEEHFISKQLETHRLRLQGEILYAIPQKLAEAPPPSRGVLRIGLPLCSVRSGHIVPTHALALALTTQDVRRECRLPYGDARILAYLAGETIPCTLHDGFALVTIDGVPLGFGKTVQGTLKNHYPKGLRRKYDFVLSKTPHSTSETDGDPTTATT
ncbi:RsmB/NOP family class I SAM-dependent RNA methyltransferase [Sulfoacidibacillus thermotolerans]|uniref:SAM-dependent MTase RsmB/NOP-type domain-containing protein n=1 Tax=Sulfoacidibacillus thermotolerans TaxID=1765684 RepID=A0A2U3D908_SULT2|nr:RsmB/NOP family class I SAM-dependent RNA methyltransferase [Sulfoacidibacillus thermotolerans]PWI57761.1 hypothetical protein BM613_07210 [Sulfoacidibacillus thermotolerans]